jgi:hypothetical protein
MVDRPQIKEKNLFCRGSVDGSVDIDRRPVDYVWTHLEVPHFPAIAWSDLVEEYRQVRGVKGCSVAYERYINKLNDDDLMTIR